MKKVKLAIIGCGAIARDKHVPALLKIEEVQIVALCDIIVERAESFKDTFAEEANVYKDYKELLEKEQIDVVHVLTPNRTHSEISIAAMEAGCHVMCEKPMAINEAEAKKMLQVSKKTGKKLTVGYQSRYGKESKYLKKECEKGTLGDIYFAKAHAIRRRAVPTWGVFLNEYEQGGGPLIDIGTHALDLTLWMMDNYKPKFCVGKTFKKLNDHKGNSGNAWGNWDVSEFTVEDSAFGFIVMENGALITLESAWALNTLDVHEAKCTLCGTEAGADMMDGLRINSIKNNTQIVEKPDFSASGAAFHEGATGDVPSHIEAKQWIDAVLNDTEPCVTANQAYVVSAILDGIYESAKTGKPHYFENI